MKLLRLFLRFFFNHFYTTLAWSYDAIAYAVSIGQWNTWVRLAAEPVERGPVLEIGHGPGHLMRKLGQLDRSVVGVDASRQMTRLASRRLRKLNPSPSIVQAEAQALPFPAGYFNTLITTFPTEFMMDPSTIAQVSRTLRPKGRVIVIPVAEIHGRSLVDRAAAWLFRVTGQSGELPDSWYAPYVQAGFDIAREDIDIGRSSVTRITATKNSAEIAP